MLRGAELETKCYTTAISVQGLPHHLKYCYSYILQLRPGLLHQPKNYLPYQARCHLLGALAFYHHRRPLILQVKVKA